MSVPPVVVNDIAPRIQFTAAGGQTVFTYPFLIFELTDLNVFQTPAGQLGNDVAQKLTYNIQYTVTNNVQPAVGGFITLNTPANAGDIITIIRNMPESRLNNYLNGGLFNAQQVNGDFDSEVLMIQQNSMSQHNCGPYYNYSSVITPVVDNVLPILPPNCVWMKNGSNTAIVAVQFNGGGGGGGGAILPSRINAVATFNTTTGIIQSSGINILPPDILGNVTITTQPGGTGNIVITPAGAGTVGISSIVGIFNGMTVNWFDAPNAFSVNWSAPAALAGNTTYQWPPAYPTVPTMFLASGASGVTNWVSGTIITDTLIHNAQVLGMSAAPVLILPALGAGFGYIIKSFFVQVVFSGNAFANGGVIVLQYGNAALGAGTNTISNSTANTMPANVLTGAAANQFATLVNNTNWVATATAGITNTGVYLSNQTGAFTNAAGGASSLNVSVEYMVVPMT